MDVATKAGMWITQNLISHQGDYYIHHIKNVVDNQVFMDVTIGISKMTQGVWGKSWSTSFGDDERGIQMPSGVFSKQMFQKMKRPSPDIRRATIKILFETEGR